MAAPTSPKIGPGGSPERSADSSSTQGGKNEKLNFKELPEISDRSTHGVQVIDGRQPLFEDFKKRPNESGWRYVWRLCSEGHTVPDAFLTVAASQIGQIMLTTPNALWKAGLVSGGIFMFVTIIFSFFTMYLMNALYVEYKRAKVNEGKWTKDRPITQYHDVMGFHAGKWIGWIAQFIIVLQLMGTGIAQVIACAADWYSIDKSMSKRELQVIWGGVLQLFIFFPTFKHFRLLNIAALAGTTMTAIFLLVIAAQQGYGNWDRLRLWPATVPGSVFTAPQYFFTGSAVLLNALGGHAIAMEMMDAMETPRQYSAAYSGGWLWTIFLIVPPSIAINLAFPLAIGGADNVYGIIPMSKAKVASVALMIAHQLAAYAYYVTPVLYLWEKLIKTHHSPWYIRLPSRLPVSLAIWAFAMAFPFYGSINALMSSVSVPFTAFALPCFVFIWIYRKPERRTMAVLPPFSIFKAKNWLPMFFLCGFAAVVYLGFGFAAISYSIKSIVDNSKTFGVFARCYQCPANYQALLHDPSNPL